MRAYRRGAERVRATPQPVAELYARGGVAALDGLPEIGRSLASVIAELVRTGRSSLLERLEGQVSPEDRFTTVAGIGEELAKRVHAELGLESLEELELAAHDGRLARVPGFGPRRVLAVQQSLAGILGREAARRGKARAPHRGMAMSRDRAHRIWRGVGLQAPRRRPRRRIAANRPRPLPASGVNQVWPYDLVHDACERASIEVSDGDRRVHAGLSRD